MVKEFTENELALIKACLIIIDEVIKTLNKTYAVFNKKLRPKGVCKKELNELIESIRDLDETKKDVDLAYFIFPKDKGNLKFR